MTTFSIPCDRCGSLEKTANGHCIPCERARMAARMSKPCVKCGQTERGAFGNCKACARNYARLRNATPEGKTAKRASRDNTPEAKALRAAKRSTEEQLWRRRKRRTKAQVKERELAYARRPDVRLRRYARRYNLSGAELKAKIEGQRGRCAACHGPLTPGRGTHIDHDHASGVVRGILCHDCNLAEGFLHGSPKRARQIAAYLERWLKGGMAQQSEDGHQQARERLWCSPHCLGVEPPRQGDLFPKVPA